MNKYVGIYRVLAERDSDGNPLEFTYLVGAKSYPKYTIYRYNEDVLSLTIVAKSSQVINTVVKTMAEEGVQFTKFVDCGNECILRFKESDIPLVGSIIKLKTSGAKIPPESIKNHYNYKQIKQDRYDNMSDEEKLEMKKKGELLRQRLQASKQQ